MNHTLKLAISSALAALIFQVLPAHAAGTFALTSGIDYSSGKYGQTESTDIICIPFVAKYENDNTTLKLTIPWLQITGPGYVVGGANSPVVIGTNNSHAVSTQSGLGDVILTATQSVARFGESKPLLLDLTGKIKFATASTSKGLGTGEMDYTVELDAYKPLNNSVTLFGDIGYKLMGDPATINLNNVWFSTAGLSYKFSSITSAGIMADIRQATLNSTQPLREMTMFFTHKFNANYKLQGYLSQGYSDSSADWGGGALLGWSF